MRELVISFINAISDQFDGKTVGTGGDFGATLTVGPYDIKTMFHQWDDIVNPSIHVQVIQERLISNNFECCGGVTELLLNVRISADQKPSGWSIASTLYEALRTWLCEINYTLSPVGETYVVIIDQDIKADDVYEGDIFSKHVKIRLIYLRRFET